MKIKIFAVGAAALLVLTASLWGADFAGKWALKAGEADITLTFKVDGTTVTGTVDNSQVGPADIKEGKIEGDTVSFHVVRKMGESDLKIMWKGKIAGDEIKFTRQSQGGAGGPGGGGAAEEFAAKRVK